MALKLYIPTSLLDLSAKQRLYISRLFLQGYSKTEFLVKAFLFLSGIKLLTNRAPEPDGARWYAHKSLKKPFILETEHILAISLKLDFLLTPDEVNPIRWIGTARARHFRMYNASFEEYLMAENYYFAYIETKKEQHLDNLISVVYRRPWQQWNASKIQARARQFRNTPPELKNAVFAWYVGFRAYVPRRCKTLFSGGKKSGAAFNPRNYINGMIHQLNNGDITIKDKLLKQPCWDALDELEQRAIDYELANKK